MTGPWWHYPIQTLLMPGSKEFFSLRRKLTPAISCDCWERREFGLKHLDYSYQKGRRNPDALSLQSFCIGRANLCSLGDTSSKTYLRGGEKYKKQEHGAKILLKEVPDAQRFGVAEIQNDRVVGMRKNPLLRVQLCGYRIYSMTRRYFKKFVA